jgi:hypothetical protein
MIKLAFALSHALTFPAQDDIYLEVIGQPEKAKAQIFYAPHENEAVANNYVAEKIKKFGGALIIMRQQGTRNITLHINKHNVYVDPNRIFTKAGIRSSIEKLNPNLNSNSVIFTLAVERAYQLGKFVLTQLQDKSKAPTWVALHNNTEGFEGDNNQGRGDVSIYRYQAKLSNGVGFLIDVNVGYDQDEDNLFYVTKAEDFDVMRKYHWNVVLQNPKVTSDPKEDDGSLSVYAQMHNIRYINIEAERQDVDNLGKNSTETQQEMIDFIYYVTRSDNTTASP